ncbi:hypothetical protein IF650_08365 [Cellulosimicrobium terreum]|nr:hypothetical protein [Cellulosimicrobium terreum]
MIFVLESVAWTGPRARAVFGSTLVLTGTGSMLAAALVLLLSSRAHRQAAIRQGALPLLAVLAVVVGLTT